MTKEQEATLAHEQAQKAAEARWGNLLCGCVSCLIRWLGGVLKRGCVAGRAALEKKLEAMQSKIRMVRYSLSWLYTRRSLLQGTRGIHCIRGLGGRGA